jgi:hypothetical protein
MVRDSDLRIICPFDRRFDFCSAFHVHRNSNLGQRSYLNLLDPTDVSRGLLPVCISRSEKRTFGRHGNV